MYKPIQNYQIVELIKEQSRLTSPVAYELTYFFKGSFEPRIKKLALVII